MDPNHKIELGDRPYVDKSTSAVASANCEVGHEARFTSVRDISPFP